MILRCAFCLPKPTYLTCLLPTQPTCHLPNLPTKPSYLTCLPTVTYLILVKPMIKCGVTRRLGEPFGIASRGFAAETERFGGQEEVGSFFY